MTSEAREGEREWARGAWVGVRVLIEGVEMDGPALGGKRRKTEGIRGKRRSRIFVDGWPNAKDQTKGHSNSFVIEAARTGA